jgi:hypothetical protein
VTQRPGPWPEWSASGPADKRSRPSGAGYGISEVPPTPQLAGWVKSVTEAAARADGVAPLSEDALLHLPASREATTRDAATPTGSSPQSRDFVLSTGEGTMVGYA